ncbi:MAG: GNAT family N-acetyltransferase [Acidimicrobiales bacterium]
MIRSYDESDADQVIALNAACQPEVGSLERGKLDGFADWAPYFKVVDVDGVIVGFLVGLTEDAPYASPNFGWFVERYPLFAYIDRIAVSESERGSGWGPALYRHFEQWAIDNQRPMLCAEVNVEPPNPRSLRFHEIFGFDSVEQFEPTGSPDYRVVMLRKGLDR